MVMRDLLHLLFAVIGDLLSSSKAHKFYIVNKNE